MAREYQSSSENQKGLWGIAGMVSEKLVWLYGICKK
jgi:hypothetical protein